mmetsp:Transcript_30914/g.64258  ORF Transcript_30914/g.64258 Transcript_30914/m.64258 type:complete len:238 (-) Transcript_30914:334-1047(-)
MRKCRSSDVRSAPIWRSVQRLVQKARKTRDFGKMFIAIHFGVNVKSQRWHDGTQIGISRPLSNPVDGSLNQADTRLGSRQTIRHSQSAIIMSMHTQGHFATKLLHGTAGNLFHLPGHTPSIRIAHDQHLRPGIHRRPTTIQGIPRIELMPIEEMLQIHHDLPPQRRQIRNRIPNHLQILLGIRANDVGDLPQMRLGHDAHRRGLALDQFCDLGVVVGFGVLSSGGSEGDQFGFGDGV